MDKVCAVFGGSRGIGKAVAQLMAQKGYRLAIVSRNLEVAKATAGELGGRYRKFLRRAAEVRVLELQSTGAPAHVLQSAPRITHAPGPSPHWGSRLPQAESEAP